MSSPTNERSGKLPLVVWVMAAGTFLMGTTEFVIAGLLPETADDLGVSVSRTGLLITAFAVGMIVGAPLMAIATLRLPHRSTLVMAHLPADPLPRDLRAAPPPQRGGAEVARRVVEEGSERGEGHGAVSLS